MKSLLGKGQKVAGRGEMHAGKVVKGILGRDKRHAGKRTACWERVKVKLEIMAVT